MRLYAQLPARATRQVIGDVLLLAWVIVWVDAAKRVHDVVGRLAAPGRRVEDAGLGLARSMRDVSGRVDDVPGAGRALASPFRSAGTAASGLADAGRAQQDAVHTVAVLLALIVAAVPIAWAIVHWLPRRVRWIRDAAAAEALRGDPELFALRALVNRPLAELAELGDAPSRGWLRRDPTAIAGLARLEFRHLGLRVPADLAMDVGPTQRPG